jgi:hypothetical protein
MIMKAMDLDGIARELGEGATRRGFLGLLGRVSAVAAVAAVGASGLGESATAKRRGRKRGKRKSSGQGQTTQYQVSAAATSIPPNCIFVCCDGTCDSWKMCLKCVKWPKPKTTTTLAAW